MEARQGRLGRARALLMQALTRHPRFVPALLALARVQRLRGEVKEAQLTLRKAATVRVPCVR